MVYEKTASSEPSARFVCGGENFIGRSVAVLVCGFLCMGDLSRGHLPNVAFFVDQVCRSTDRCELDTRLLGHGLDDSCCCSDCDILLSSFNGVLANQ